MKAPELTLAAALALASQAKGRAQSAFMASSQRLADAHIALRAQSSKADHRLALALADEAADHFTDAYIELERARKNLSIATARMRASELNPPQQN